MLAISRAGRRCRGDAVDAKIIRLVVSVGYESSWQRQAELGLGYHPDVPCGSYEARDVELDFEPRVEARRTTTSRQWAVSR